MFDNATKRSYGWNGTPIANVASRLYTMPCGNRAAIAARLRMVAIASLTQGVPECWLQYPRRRST